MAIGPSEHFLYSTQRVDLPFQKAWDEKSLERQRIHAAFADRAITHPGTQRAWDALVECDAAIDAMIVACGGTPRK